MAIQVDDELNYRGCRVTRELVLGGEEVGVQEFIQQMIAKCDVDASTLVLLTTLLCVLSDEFLLVEGLFPRRDGGSSTGVGRARECITSPSGQA